MSEPIIELVNADNEHFTDPRRIFQVTRYPDSSSSATSQIRNIELVHSYYGRAPRTNDPLTNPDVVSGIDGPTLIQVEAISGTAFYKVLTAEDAKAATALFDRVKDGLPPSLMQNVYVELVSPATKETGVFDSLPVVKADQPK